jgi:putative ABC transport system permease protein
MKNRGFTAVAVLTLALGIGINTSLFSLVHAVLLRPLPYTDADRLVLLWGTRSQENDNQLFFSVPNYNDIKTESESFETMALLTVGRFNLASEGQPEQVQSVMATASFFDVFQVKPLHGRLFSATDDEPGIPRIAVISHSLWARKYASDPDVIGRGIMLDGQTWEIVGVLPADFGFISSPAPTEVWTPFGLDTFRDRRFARDVHSAGVVGRLKPGVTKAQAQTEMDTIAGRLEQEYPRSNHGRGISVMPLREQSVKNLRTALFALLAAVSFVLLIACANVASLLMARATSRRREIAIRAALGATRGRLIRQFVTESVLLSLVGGGAGIIVAFWGSSALSILPYQPYQLYNVYTIPSDQVGVNMAVLAYAILLSLATGLIFGLFPAVYGSRLDLSDALKDGNAAAGERSGAWGRSLLVTGEVALSIILLIGAGLMIRSFVRLIRVDPGFRAAEVVAVDLNLSHARYREPANLTAFYGELMSRLSNVQGVESVGGVESLPLVGSESMAAILVPGKQFSPSEEPRAVYSAVMGGYFKTMGIRLAQGRDFTEADRKDSARVAVINEAMARRCFPGEDPIGKKVALVFEALRFFPDRPPELDLARGLREVVGVVSDVKQSRLEDESKAAFYTPFDQRPVAQLTIVVRSATGADALIETIRRTVSEIDKDQPIASARTLDEVVARTVAPARFSAWLIGVFSALALALAAVGLYGLIAYNVTQRTREIGVRVALGARRSDVLRLVLVRGFKLTAAGILAGILGAYVLTRWISGLLFQVQATDPLIFGGIALLVLGVSMAACYIPARRAASVDPITALRCE